MALWIHQQACTHTRVLGYFRTRMIDNMTSKNILNSISSRMHVSWLSNPSMAAVNTIAHTKMIVGLYNFGTRILVDIRARCGCELTSSFHCFIILVRVYVELLILRLYFNSSTGIHSVQLNFWVRSMRFFWIVLLLLESTTFCACVSCNQSEFWA